MRPDALARVHRPLARRKEQHQNLAGAHVGQQGLQASGQRSSHLPRGPLNSRRRDLRGLPGDLLGLCLQSPIRQR